MGVAGQVYLQICAQADLLILERLDALLELVLLRVEGLPRPAHIEAVCKRAYGPTGYVHGHAERLPRKLLVVQYLLH